VWNVIVILSVSLVIGGCGGEKSQKGDGSSAGETVYVKGTVSVRGSTPFELLLLQADDGTVYMIDSSPTAGELKNLDGMEVGVSAMILPDVGGDAPALSVQQYELLPFPTGGRPIIGVITGRSLDEVYLYADDGSTIRLDGDFKALFSGFVGAKVWIVGDTKISAVTTGGNVKTMNVTEYGIIREAR
jgi:hypothetical protein